MMNEQDKEVLLQAFHYLVEQEVFGDPIRGNMYGSKSTLTTILEAYDLGYQRARKEYDVRQERMV